MDEKGKQPDYINWEIIGKDLSFLAMVTEDILDKNFPDFFQAKKNEMVSSVKEGRKAISLEQPEDYKKHKDNLVKLESLQAVKDYCQQNGLKDLQENELKHLADLHYYHIEAEGPEGVIEPGPDEPKN